MTPDTNSLTLGTAYKRGEDETVKSKPMISVTATTGLLDTIAAAGANPVRSCERLDSSGRSWRIRTAAYGGNFAVTPIAVPEPETYAMLLAGLGMLGLSARRRKSQSSENRNNRHAH